jgi:hypothetical protein
MNWRRSSRAVGETPPRLLSPLAGTQRSKLAGRRYLVLFELSIR